MRTSVAMKNRNPAPSAKLDLWLSPATTVVSEVMGFVNSDGLSRLADH